MGFGEEVQHRGGAGGGTGTARAGAPRDRALHRAAGQPPGPRAAEGLHGEQREATTLASPPL